MPTHILVDDDRGRKLREARERAGLTGETAAARMNPPIGKHAWFDAERGRWRNLEWWYFAALAVGADPHEIDPRLASNRKGKHK